MVSQSLCSAHVLYSFFSTSFLPISGCSAVSYSNLLDLPITLLEGPGEY